MEVGRLRSIGIGKESSAGTAVSPTFWIPLQSGIVIPDVTYINDESSMGRLETPLGAEIGTRLARFNGSAPVRSDWIAMILAAALGSVSSETASGEAAVYEHTITVGTDEEGPTYTLTKKDGVATECSTYAMLNTLGFSCETAGYLMAEMEFIGRALTSDSESVSYAQDQLFNSSECTVKLASSISGLSGASAVGFRRFNFTIDKGLEQDFAFNDTDFNKQVATRFAVEGELEIIHEANTYRDYVQDGTKQALQIDFSKSNTIGSAENPQIRFQFADLSFESFGLTDGNDDVVVETLSFRANYDANESTPQLMNAFVTNEDSGANY